MSDWPSGPRMVWELMGQPAPSGDVARLFVPCEAPCVMCGLVEPVTAPTSDKRILGGNVTDQYLFARPDSPRMCPGCFWSRAGRGLVSPRQWTVVARIDREAPPNADKVPFAQQAHVHWTSKTNLRWVAETLWEPPDSSWLMSVAESSQKHHLPWARINRGERWTVRMVLVDVAGTTGEWRAMFRPVVALRQAGFSPDEIETGRPSIPHIIAHADLWRTHGEPLTAAGRSPLLHLAVFVATKKDDLDYLAALAG
jgi:hypothetical protein